MGSMMMTFVKKSRISTGRKQSFGMAKKHFLAYYVLVHDIMLKKTKKDSP